MLVLVLALTTGCYNMISFHSIIPQKQWNISVSLKGNFTLKVGSQDNWACWFITGNRGPWMSPGADTHARLLQIHRSNHSFQAALSLRCDISICSLSDLFQQFWSWLLSFSLSENQEMVLMFHCPTYQTYLAM